MLSWRVLKDLRTCYVGALSPPKDFGSEGDSSAIGKYRVYIGEDIILVQNTWLYFLKVNDVVALIYLPR